MRPVLPVTVALAACLAITGCSETVSGTATAPETLSATAIPTSTNTVPAPGTTTSAPPPGAVVGTAVMRLIGGAGAVTIRFRINGGPEQTVTATTPWEQTFEVRDRMPTQFTADGGDAELTCTIMMGEMLVALVSQPRPTCGFQYFG
ncbi:hypothetical protein [Tsukamurella strandjordii]|uniref:MmpS family membrane protein n=1 Tax=Tsukamurella strandjordii TaxID=147577 RepID=A0AA90NEP2_9ACTN|nr:hypothetical protein [Tsukamurella strandjordii]MDP0398997.1 hypothetical protein [Tsukamurella strandjordii]